MKIKKPLILGAILSFALVLPVHADTEGIPQQIQDILSRLDNLSSIFASKSDVDALKTTIASQQKEIDALQAEQKRSIVKVNYNGYYPNGNGPGFGTITINVGIPNINVSLNMDDGGNQLASGLTGEDGKITFEYVPLTMSMGEEKNAEIHSTHYSGKVDVYSMPDMEETFTITPTPK